MIEKILNEINRLKKELKGYSASEALDYIEAYINTLPEESKCIYNRTLEERKKFCKYCSAACNVRIEEEPVSADLEEAAENYAQQHNELLGFDCDCEPIQTGPELKKAVIFGAEWQKQTMKNALQTEYEKGRFDKREEMMKDALDGCVSLIVKSDTSSRNLFISTPQLYKELQKYEDGDKVKIIIIKTK